MDIQGIADKLFVSPSHLMRVYKTETGKNITDMLQHKRIDEACCLLKQSKLKVTDIAFMVGYKFSPILLQDLQRHHKHDAERLP